MIRRSYPHLNRKSYLVTVYGVEIKKIGDLAGKYGNLAF